MERTIRTLTDAGFSARDAMCGLNTIYCFTIGFTIEEQVVFPRPGQRAEQYDPAARAERVDDLERLPLVRATGDEVLGNFDERFEHGLQVIIGGLVRSLPGRADP
jgi:TetR/AcrR family tetracycline transcriptional repressor